MNYTAELEIYRQHLERSLGRTAGLRLFGKSGKENFRDWELYCLRTNNAEVMAEK